MFTAAETKIVARRNIDLIDAGAHFVVARVTDDVVSLTDENIRFAITPSIEAYAHLPSANPLAFDDRVRRDVEILDLQTVAAPAAAAATVVSCRGIGSKIDHHGTQEPG